MVTKKALIHDVHAKAIPGAFEWEFAGVLGNALNISIINAFDMICNGAMLTKAQFVALDKQIMEEMHIAAFLRQEIDDMRDSHRKPLSEIIRSLYQRRARR